MCPILSSMRLSGSLIFRRLKSSISSNSNSHSPLAGLGFGATQQLGETTGIYMGYSVDTGRNVYLQPSLASQGIKGTVTNALASAFVGSLGGGKSFCNNLLVYYAVLFGGQALLLDPKP